MAKEYSPLTATDSSVTHPQSITGSSLFCTSIKKQCKQSFPNPGFRWEDVENWPPVSTFRRSVQKIDLGESRDEDTDKRILKK